MAQVRQRLNGILRYPLLDFHYRLPVDIGGIGAGETVPAWRIDSFLHRHAVIDEVADHLCAPLCLLVAARRTAYQPGSPVLENHVGVERVHRAATGRHYVRVIRVEAETAACAIVEND